MYGVMTPKEKIRWGDSGVEVWGGRVVFLLGSKTMYLNKKSNKIGVGLLSHG